MKLLQAWRDHKRIDQQIAEASHVICTSHLNSLESLLDSVVLNAMFTCGARLNARGKRHVQSRRSRMTQVLLVLNGSGLMNSNAESSLQSGRRCTLQATFNSVDLTNIDLKVHEARRREAWILCNAAPARMQRVICQKFNQVRSLLKMKPSKKPILLFFLHPT